MCNNDESENSLTLISPNEPSMSFDGATPVAEKPDIEDVFSFDDDASGSCSDKQINIFIEADVISIDSKNSEEALDYTNLRSPEKSALSYIIFGHSRISNTSLEETAGSPAEAPIPIPSTFKRTFELTPIDCEVRSKKV
ncbi:wd repeat-containing protein 81-like protein [Lasius niger]|uniref:Wd repeat-containing protein 81-like protein n=1 Tax=Lasius niger TaxID=67767 RepID=A0A0J7JSQ0_LASNI|nr:wd repeat-containing protein 81-like protein [Lasius niger]